MRVLALAFLIVTAAAEAQYPAKPLRIVVPSPVGGPSDVGARIIGQKIAESLGQPVIIDNRPGGNNIIGSQVVAKAAPDGYTLLMALDSTLTMHPSLYANLPYDPAKDFAPVALAFVSPIVLITDAGGPASIRELLQLARANPGKVSFGAGTLTTRLGGELLKNQTNTDMLIIPYKGSAGTTQGLLSKDVTFILDGATTSMPHIRSGKLKVLANLSRRSIAALPNLPSFAAEAGIEGFDVSVWLGFVAPAGTPPEIIARLNQEIVRVLGHPDVKEKLSLTGLDAADPGTPAQFASYIRSETERWSRVIKASGFKAE
ncbi:MAG: Bug family tripartite tricarboxylate transporter substrate binding protein [Burkholderiales bacterium]